MRNCVVLVVLILSGCVSAPKMGRDIGPCQVPPTIVFKSELGRLSVCTPGDTQTWRKISVHYDARSGYTNSGISTLAGDFYAAPGKECADMKGGLIPRAVDACEAFASDASE